MRTSPHFERLAFARRVALLAVALRVAALGAAGLAAEALDARALEAGPLDVALLPGLRVLRVVERVAVLAFLVGRFLDVALTVRVRLTEGAASSASAAGAVPVAGSRGTRSASIHKPSRSYKERTSFWKT